MWYVCLYVCRRHIKIELTFNIVAEQRRTEKNKSHLYFIIIVYLYNYVHTHILLHRAKMKCSHCVVLMF